MVFKYIFIALYCSIIVSFISPSKIPNLIESYELLNPLDIRDGRLARKIDSFTDNNFKFADCATVGANQLTVKPNGDVTVCHGYCKTDKQTRKQGKKGWR